jgi:hypothetical protein
MSPLQYAYVSMCRRTLIALIAVLASSWVLPARGAQTDSGEGLTVDINLGNDRPDSVLAILREAHAKNGRGNAHVCQKPEPEEKRSALASGIEFATGSRSLPGSFTIVPSTRQ